MYTDKEVRLRLEAWETDWLTTVRSAFPAKVSADAESAARLFGISEGMAGGGAETVYVSGEQLRIPSRIYAQLPVMVDTEELSSRARIVLGCLLTRHHDGRTREEAVEMMIAGRDEFVAPFVAALAGEYVIEVVDAVGRSLNLNDPKRKDAYARFAAANHGFLQLIEQRAKSYWNAYYRSKCPEYRNYPGAQLVAAIRDAAAEPKMRK